jgi:glyoxylate reductase
MARVLITRRLPGEALGRLTDEHEVEVWPERLPPPPERLRELVADAAGLLSMVTDRIDGELLDAAPQLRAIANYAVGTDNIDLEAAAERGIPVGNTPDVVTDATADLAWALLLALARRVPWGMADVLGGEWKTWEPERNLGADVTGATLGIIGYGRIGKAVARRAAGFDMEVVHTGSRHGGVPVEHVLDRADFVSLHVPLKPETQGLISKRAFELMKPTALLINTSRGPVVDHEALRWALEDGEIAGAGLDVTDPEPLPADHPLLQAPNLLVVPHVGAATVGTREKMTALAVDNLLAGLAGERMPHQANDPRQPAPKDQP